LLLLLVAAIAYAGYELRINLGLGRDVTPRYIIRDIHSLIMIPDDKGGCRTAVGYREKYVIGRFLAVPVKKITCDEYYFQERPAAKDYDATIVLVRLDINEYHWILESQLGSPLKN
jgi:hypothetical protein